MVRSARVGRDVATMSTAKTLQVQSLICAYDAEMRLLSRSVQRSQCLFKRSSRSLVFRSSAATNTLPWKVPAASSEEIGKRPIGEGRNSENKQSGAKYFMGVLTGVVNQLQLCIQLPVIFQGLQMQVVEGLRRTEGIVRTRKPSFLASEASRTMPLTQMFLRRQGSRFQ